VLVIALSFVLVNLAVDTLYSVAGPEIIIPIKDAKPPMKVVARDDRRSSSLLATH